MKKLVLAIFSVLSFTANAAVIELDFSDTFANYGNQFKTGTVGAGDGGKTLSMFGNNWVAFEGVYNITADTILQVTFFSSQLGELHGFGFDNDIVFDNFEDFQNGENRYFQFAGTQTFGVQDYNTYTAPNTIETFTVEIGKFLTGTFSQLVFINDQDKSGANAQSSYSIATSDSNFVASVNGPGVLTLMLMSLTLMFVSKKNRK
ncbi:hypothetical protein [Alteromonas sp. BZK5]|uniref:hypothetical protein n=1 Tax=Alteromonas sp. BZK5 TaxID=1904459 RepID=UPI0016537BB4|nr:hypothetical protein [Alteromonas sp. BZK5]MBC6984628.1 hypothetical protein [Alteromonas sp. BZK5]